MKKVFLAIICTLAIGNQAFASKIEGRLSKSKLECVHILTDQIKASLDLQGGDGLGRVLGLFTDSNGIAEKIAFVDSGDIVDEKGSKIGKLVEEGEESILVKINESELICQ